MVQKCNCLCLFPSINILVCCERCLLVFYYLFFFLEVFTFVELYLEAKFWKWDLFLTSCYNASSNMHGLLDHNTNQWSCQSLTGLQLENLRRGPLTLGAWVCVLLLHFFSCIYMIFCVVLKVPSNSCYCHH